MKKHWGILITLATVSALQILGFRSALAAPRPPMPPLPEFVRVTFSERFDAPYAKDATAAEAIVSGLGTLRESWSGYSLERVGVVLPFLIPGVDGNGHTNLTGASGAIRLWVKPYWSSATVGTNSGPGHVAQLLEMSVVGAGRSVPVWSLQVSPDGSEISLVEAGAQAPVVLLAAEIAWQAGEWHQAILNRSEQGTALILDGEIVAEGAGVLAVPSPVAALAVGSSLVGTESIEGELEEVFCFMRPLKMAFHWSPLKDVAALGPISAAELAYRGELVAELQAQRAAKTEQATELWEGGGMQMMMSGPLANCVTNGPVYLTNVVVTMTTNEGWTIYFDVAGGTNGVVYDLFSTPAIVGGDLTNSVWTWLESAQTCETHFFDHQSPGGSFYVLTLPEADRDGDSLYDGWEWKHFGTLAQAADEDFDGDGRINLVEFSAGSDPNTIVFDVQFENLQVNANTASGTFAVLKGVPNQMAVLMDSTSFASATWLPYNSNLSVDLGSTDGPHDVWIGLKGRTATSAATWSAWSLTRDTAAPVIVITNPVTTTISQPAIQLQGYSPEPLISLRYDVTNAAGNLTNEEGYVTKQWFDTNLFEPTTNWFECVDIGLATGTNRVTLRATDLAGNVATNIYTYLLSYSNDASAPVLTLYWPQNGTQISGDSFTLRGWLDDATASVTAQIVDANDGTNVVKGLLERDGLLWVEDLPLGGGANTLILTMTDAAGNMSVTNLAIVQSTVLLVMDDLTSVDLNQPRITVTGTINVNDHKVWVNGVQASPTGQNGEGLYTWSAGNVPVNPGGTAVVQAVAIPNTDNGTGGNGGSGATMQDPGNPASPNGKTVEASPDKQPEVVMIRYFKNWDFASVELDEAPWTDDETEHIQWALGLPGSWTDDACWGSVVSDIYYYGWNDRRWDAISLGTVKGSLAPGHRGDVCGVQNLVVAYPYTAPTWWPGESCAGRDSRIFLTDYLQMYDQVVKRKARTRYELHTGGKKVAGRKNLFVLTASATGDANLFYPEIDEYPDSYLIAPTSIQLGDLGKLGSDERLYKALGDGETHDITPLVAGSRYYRYDQPGASKHKPYVTANGEPLSPDKLNVTNCVGQKIVFALQFDPAWPAGVQATGYDWVFSPKYVNAWEEYSGMEWNSYWMHACHPETNWFSRAWDQGAAPATPYCKFYQAIAWPLKQSETGAWWVSGGNKLTRLFAELTFANGQKASLITDGRFKMLKPEIMQVIQQYPHGGIIETNSEETPFPMLSLGNSSMEFKVYISQTFPGKFGLTQRPRNSFFCKFIQRQTEGGFWFSMLR